jgi:hypothetical protein
MADITNILIDTSTIPAVGKNKYLEIQGDVGAQCLLQVVASNNTFYNFETNAFTSTHSPLNVKKVILASSSYSTRIYFPAATGVDYFVLVTKEPLSDTSVLQGAYIKKISTVTNTTLTFAAATTNTNKYTTDPAFSNISVVGSSADTSSTLVSPSASAVTVNNATTDAGSFGFNLKKERVEDRDFYFETTDTVDGAITSATSVKVDDLTNIVVGMTINAVSSGSLTGTPKVTAIDINTKTLTLGTAQTFADGITLTFRATGFTVINSAIGSDITYNSGNVSNTVKTNLQLITVRSAVSNSTNITVNKTQGIPGGSVCQFNGVGVDNTSTNNINVVTPDPSGGDGDGLFTCDVAQTLTEGTKLSFKSIDTTAKSGPFTSLACNFSLNVNSFPLSNHTINLNLDNIIKPGTAS